jgi:hypothetical protein
MVNDAGLEVFLEDHDAPAAAIVLPGSVPGRS